MNLRDGQKIGRYNNTKSLSTNKQKKQNKTNQATKNPHHQQQSQTTFSSPFSVIMSLLFNSVQSLQGYCRPGSTTFFKFVFVKVELQPFKNKQTNRQ